jgi:hypothetical protein
VVALILCGLAFGLAFLAGRRSLVAGLGAVLLVGYLYGIVRANVTSAFSHFIFDAAIVGLYSTQLLRPLSPEDRERTRQFRAWLALLIFWPLFLLIIPLQDPMVQLVGLRAHIFFLPFLLLGTRLRREEVYRLAVCLAVLNLVAFGFALGEFFFGLRHFYPENEVTALIYRSNDIRSAGSLRGAFRIPATFANSGGYGATMAITLPLLLGAWTQRTSKRSGFLLIAAVGVSALGVFFSATRTNILVLGIILMLSLMRGGLGAAGRMIWAFLVIAVGLAVSTNERLFLRLLSLSPEAVLDRISWSLNRGVFDLLAKYPLGNGLGGGGTSMPYFLLHLVRNPMPVEGQYATIMLEQGLPGLLLWFGFLVWVLSRRAARPGNPWNSARSVARVTCAAFLLTGFIGEGLFTSIPFTPILFLLMGWLAVSEPRPIPQGRAAQRAQRIATAVPASLQPTTGS